MPAAGVQLAVAIITWLIIRVRLYQYEQIRPGLSGFCFHHNSDWLDIRHAASQNLVNAKGMPEKTKRFLWTKSQPGAWYTDPWNDPRLRLMSSAYSFHVF